MSRFFCDSNCELWFERFDELNIELIKMPYTIDGVEAEYDLGRNTDNRAFFDKMKKGGAAKTSALNQMNYVDYFEPFLKKGEDIIYVSFSQNMSATFDSMNMAIEELKKTYPDRTISVVDSGHISMGAGLCVYFAAKKHNEGASDADVVAFVEQFRKKVQCYFTVDDLVYLKRGGRLSAFKTMMGTIFNMKPIITMGEDGKLVNIGTVKGRKKAISTVINYLDEKNIDLSYPVVLMDGDSTQDMELTKQLILEKYPTVTIWQQLVGPVVGSHCGPGTIAVLFVSKND